MFIKLVTHSGVRFLMRDYKVCALTLRSSQNKRIEQACCTVTQTIQNNAVLEQYCTWTILYLNNTVLEQYCTWAMDHLNVQHYQDKLGDSLHPNTLNKLEGHGSLHHTQNLYLPVRPCSDPDMGGHWNPEVDVFIHGCKQVVGLLISISLTIPFKLFFISVFALNEYFQTTVTSYPTLNIFFHSRRWCNENTTLFLKIYHFYIFCCLNWQLRRYHRIHCSLHAKSMKVTDFFLI